MSQEVPRVSQEAHSFEQLYLLAFASPPEILQHVRTQAIKQERGRLQAILAAWTQARPKVAQVMQAEAGLPDTVRVGQIPSDHTSRINEIGADPLFQSTFPGATFGVVEIDKLVAGQRTVNLNYVERLLTKYPAHPSIAELIEICLSPVREMDPIQHLEVAPNLHAFSSRNSDVRLLGSFVKDLTPDDLRYAEGGGLPTNAILVFVGYGAPQISVLRVGQRVILGNGFHRVYLLKTLGVAEIPVVIRSVQNPSIDFPDNIAGIPRDYLLNTARPSLIKDFFEPGFTTRLHVQERLRTVTVQVGASQYDVPA